MQQATTLSKVAAASALGMSALGGEASLLDPLSVNAKADMVTMRTQTVPVGERRAFAEMLDIGEDTGTPVSEDYKVPFKFTGDLEKLTINITEEKLTEEQLEKYRHGRLQGALAE